MEYAHGKVAKDEFEIDEAITNANDWINFIAGDSEELYNEFKMRKFISGSGEIFIANGKEDLSVHKRYGQGTEQE